MSAAATMMSAAAPARSHAPLIDIANLRVEFGPPAHPIIAVEGVDLTIEPGEIVGLVGESGSGKSVTALALMNLIDDPGRVRADRMTFAGRDLIAASASERRSLAGRGIGMIFQDPLTSLDPCYTVGYQLDEALRLSGNRDERTNAAARRDRALALLREVEIADPVARLRAYPHQLSGGMAQRVMIAIALVGRPQLLIADEPTTALDVTVQAQVLTLLKRLQQEAGMAMIFITHDLGVVAEIADRVVVMYAGRKVEEAAVDDLFEAPLHPYTAGLIGATPVPGAARAERLADIPGVVPPLDALPAGCAFAPRCKRVMDRCCNEQPALGEPRPGRWVACFAAEQDAA